MATAVLTGDIVGSTKLEPRGQQELGQVVVRASEAARQLWGDTVLPTPAAMFRGDGWQLVVQEAKLAMRVAIYLRASLKIPQQTLPSLTTRVAIGVGEVTFMPSGGRTSGGGEAFVLSGRALDQVPRGRLMAVAFPESVKPMTAAGLRVLTSLLDEVSARWSEGQARAVVGTLEGLRQREIAQRWPHGPATQQAIADHLRRAGWSAVADALEFFEEIIDGR